MNRTNAQKISKDIEDLTNIIASNLKPRSTTTEYTSFSSIHGTFIKIDYTLDLKNKQQI